MPCSDPIDTLIKKKKEKKVSTKKVSKVTQGWEGPAERVISPTQKCFALTFSATHFLFLCVSWDFDNIIANNNKDI